MSGEPGHRSRASAMYGSCIAAAIAAVVLPAFASSSARRGGTAQPHGVTGAIVGGHRVPIRRHPWQIALYRNVEFETAFTCGGSIRDSRHIVTAAHCVVDEHGTGNGHPSLRLELPFYVRYGSANLMRTRQVGVAAISVEPRFDRFAGRKRSAFAYDAAVLTLTRPIRFGKHGRAPQPIKFATEAEFSRFFKHGVFVTGWGHRVRRANDPQDPRLRGAALPPWSDRRCRRLFNGRKLPLVEPSLMFCAGARRSGRNACKGDSGGPVTIDARPGRRVHRKLVGIVSFGRIPCGYEGAPTVFTWVQSELLHIIHQKHPRPAHLGPGDARQTISGVRRVGHRLTCHPRDLKGADATEFVWWWEKSARDPLKKFAEPQQTVTLPPSTRGKRVTCDVRYETAGGFFYEDMSPRHATRPIRRSWASLTG